jgi:predicted phage terminase large subunit-like protein
MADIDATDAIAALARLDFGFFLRRAFAELGGADAYSHNWHIDAIIHQLDLIRSGENRRLLLTMPPRHLKSRIVSIAWVAWMLGHNPALSFLCVSYGQQLSEDYARDCLKIMQSRWYRDAFPGTVIKRSAIDDIRTTAGGRRMATSVDGATTGFGADFIIVDDPIKGQDALSQSAREKVTRWFDDTLSQRLNNQLYGSIIVVMQRLHEGDLVGVLKQREGWRELSLPAIATHDEKIQLTRGRVYLRREGCALHPARLPLRELLRKRAENPYVFASQFQQQPVPAHGNMIEAAWFQSFNLASLDRRHGQIVMSLDTASKDNPFNDYSVCLVALVIGKSVYVIDVFRARLQFNPLKAKVIELARLHGASVLLIEDASSGTALIQSLGDDEPVGVPAPTRRRPEGDKVARVMHASSIIMAGRLFLPERAHWLGDFTGEVLGFPSSRHDDQVDALSQLLIWVQERDRWRVPFNAGPELMELSPTTGHTGACGYGDELDPWGAY